MTFSKLLKELPAENTLSFQPRPYINHSVQFKNIVSAKKRLEILEKVGFNVFFFPSEMITGCDLLSDSGTTTMTNEQWAAIHLGDEAYGSNKGYFLLMEQIAQIFGEEFAQDTISSKQNAFLFHQGRAGEDALFRVIGSLGKEIVIPSNGHFDTTAANIESNNMRALNLFSPKLQARFSNKLFKGDIDIERLKNILKKDSYNIPLLYLTITNNTGGGQPVSMQNIRQVKKLCKEFLIPLFFDACRFAENAWFIKKYERGYKDKSIREIVKEMFSYVDGFSISFKKDGLVNMGGGVFLRKNGFFIKKYPYIADALTNMQIIKEGHPTYGGMSGRDIMTLVYGLQTIVKEEYLEYRIGQVQEFGDEMRKAGLPVVNPIGGHAVYLDMNEFFKDTKMKPEDFGGISFTAFLLAFYGHRACELGNFAFGYFDEKSGMEILPEVNFVRLAVPRLRYEREDLLSVVAAAKALYDNRDKIPKVKVVYGRNLPLRHFKARFAFV